MRLNNKEIYDIYEKLQLSFDNNSRYFPVKINFFIQKNKKVLKELCDIIDVSKQSIAQQYGVMDSEDVNLFHIKPENIEIAQKELNDLMNIEHDLNIMMISLKDIENLEFTPNQMEAIMFMIDEEAE